MITTNTHMLMPMGVTSLKSLVNILKMIIIVTKCYLNCFLEQD